MQNQIKLGEREMFACYLIKILRKFSEGVAIVMLFNYYFMVGLVQVEAFIIQGIMVMAYALLGLFVSFVKWSPITILVCASLCKFAGAVAYWQFQHRLMLLLLGTLGGISVDVLTPVGRNENQLIAAIQKGYTPELRPQQIASKMKRYHYIGIVASGIGSLVTGLYVMKVYKVCKSLQEPLHTIFIAYAFIGILQILVYSCIKSRVCASQAINLNENTWSDLLKTNWIKHSKMLLFLVMEGIASAVTLFAVLLCYFIERYTSEYKFLGIFAFGAVIFILIGLQCIQPCLVKKYGTASGYKVAEVVSSCFLLLVVYNDYDSYDFYDKLVNVLTSALFLGISVMFQFNNDKPKLQYLRLNINQATEKELKYVKNIANLIGNGIGLILTGYFFTYSTQFLYFFIPLIASGLLKIMIAIVISTDLNHSERARQHVEIGGSELTELQNVDVTSN